jgi:oligopeptide/dipeptide ABC transporter ATP-binding protein
MADDARERFVPIPGQPPSLLGIGEGCAFRDRCAYAHDRCAVTPPLEPRIAPDHLDACWLAVDERAGLAERHGAA